jgi:hypothetical protein
MPSDTNVIACALTELAITLAVGLPVARSVAAGRFLALALAPALGWAVFNGLALPILTAVGFTRTNVALLSAAAVLAGIAAQLRSSRGPAPQAGDVMAWALAAAAVVAMLPAMAACPKTSGGGVVLSEAMFDHSKAAIIDDIVRLGLPAGNPFFGGSGSHLAYYYLWHFAAAIPASLVGAGGWEADIALTWFTAFASLALMAGIAAVVGGVGRAGLWVVLLSLAGSARPLLRLFAAAGFLDRALAPINWPESWLFQASWAPQHLASANCVVGAVMLVSCLAATRQWPTVPVLAIVAAAGFESSAWVGGVVFAAAALPIGATLLLAAATNRRASLDFALKAAVAALLALVIASPFLRDQFLATAARQAGAPLAFHPFEVFGPLVPAAMRRALDVPAYWAILLPLQFPAIGFAGGWAMAKMVAARPGSGDGNRPFVVGLGVLGAVSLVVPWLFASTIANNDLGWRGVLPAILVLTIFAAAGVARWLAAAPRLAAAAVAMWALGMPGGVEVARGNVFGLRTSVAAAFARSPELWSAVRRDTAADERIANNPAYLAGEVRWPVNISWALLADRRSCFAGWNLARAFVPLPEAAIDRISDLFKRVFAGHGSTRDIGALATAFDCRVVVVTPDDGAWRRDPFLANPAFRLLEESAGRWRIYRVIDRGRKSR